MIQIMPEYGVSVEKYRYDLEAIRDTALQLVKDFSQAGFEIHLPVCEFTYYQELMVQLVAVIEKCMRDAPDVLQQLLYRIDVSEAGSKNVFDAADLAHLILEREFMKVVTRKLMG